MPSVRGVDHCLLISCSSRTFRRPPRGALEQGRPPAARAGPREGGVGDAVVAEKGAADGPRDLGDFRTALQPAALSWPGYSSSGSGVSDGRHRQEQGAEPAGWGWGARTACGDLEHGGRMERRMVEPGSAMGMRDRAEAMIGDGAAAGLPAAGEAKGQWKRGVARAPRRRSRADPVWAFRLGFCKCK
jgi:hypothetical protein